MRRVLVIMCFALAVAACAQAPAAAPAVDPAQSIIFYNGTILTMNPGHPSAEAIAVRGDYPFLSTNPFVHLYGFVTRVDVQSYYTCAAGDWLQDDTLPVADALSIMTIESAYALFRETEVGSLEPGKYADLIVISDDPLTVAAADLKSLSVLATMVGGRFEFCNPRNLALCPGYQPRTPQPLPDWRPPVAVRWLALLLVVGLPLGAGVGLLRAPARRALTLTRLGAVAAISGGVLWLGLWFWAMRVTPADLRDLLLWPVIVGNTLFGLSTVGLAAAARPSRLGAAGLFIAATGIIVMALGYAASVWFGLDGFLFVLIGAVGHGVGLVINGLSNLPARRRSLLGLLPLAMGLIGGVLPVVSIYIGLQGGWPEWFLGGGLGLGWLAVGILLWRAARATPPAPPRQL